MTVSPASVLEDGATNLTYTFTRTGATANALTVNFTTTGTATSGTDYTQSATGTVSFGAGNTTTTVTVDPTADATVEPDETVILTVTSGTGYNVGSARYGDRHDHQRRHGCVGGGVAGLGPGRWSHEPRLHLHARRGDAVPR